MSVRHVNGFTIFELMIVLAIAAIIAAFAVPGFKDLRVKGRINAAADEVVNSLQLARNTAIVRRRTVLLEPVADGRWELHMDTATGPLLSSHTVPAPATLKAWQGTTESNGVDEISFNPSGQVRKTKPGTAEPLSLTIRICDSSTTNEVGKNVTMTPIGRIAVAQHASKSVCNP